MNWLSRCAAAGLAAAFIAPAAQVQAIGLAKVAPGSIAAVVMNSSANILPPKGPFVSRRTSSVAAGTGVRAPDDYRNVRPPVVDAKHHAVLATYGHAFSSSPAPAVLPASRTSAEITGPRARGTHPVTGATRAPSSVTLGAYAPAGINNYWAFEQDGIPGVGRFMVNLGSSRNLVVQSDDLSIPHRWVDVALRRTYNSYSQHDYANTDGSVASNFGNGWTNTFDAHLATNNGAFGTYGITVFDTDGTRYDYTPTDSTGNTLVPPPGQHAMLVPDATHCTYYWIKKSGTQFHFRTPATATGQRCAVTSRFRATAGRLLHIYGRNSLAQLDLAYTWTGNNQSSPDYLQQIAVAIDGQNTLATLNFTTFGGTCNPVQNYRLLSSLVDAAGATTYYKYDCSGNLVEVDKPNNTSSALCAADGTNCIRNRFAYAGAHLMTAASGGRWSASLSDPNNLATGSDGGYVVFNYASGAAVASAQFVGVANPVISDGYSSGPLQPAPAPSGVQTFKTDYYDQSGNVTTWRDSDGHQTQYTFDGSDRVISHATTTGTTTLTSSRSFDLDNNLTADTDYRNNTTNYAYDSFGNTIAIAKPTVAARFNGAVQNIRPTSLYTYDSHENILSHCDPTWAALNNANWSGSGQPPSCPTTPGNTSNQGPDVYVFSDQTGHANEPYGELTDTYAANGYHYHFTYSGASEGGVSANAGLDFGNATQIRGDAFTSNGTQIAPGQQYVYDVNGNIICANKGTGWGVVVYDADGRKLQAADPDDASLNRAECPKSPGLPGTTIVQTMTYFASGAVASSQTPSEAATSTATTFTYDANGQTKTTTHHFGGTTGTTQNWYDGYDRLVEVSQPRDSTDYYPHPWLTRYYYDLTQNGFVSIATSATNLKAYGNSYKTQTYLNPPPYGTSPWTDSRGATFDGADRPTSGWETAVLSSSPVYTNTYDQTGNLPGEQTRFGLLSHTTNGNGDGADLHYDTIGRLVEKDYTNGTPQLKITFDPEGRVADKFQGGVGDEITNYDALGRASSVTTPPLGAESAPTTLNYQYYPNGWRSATGVVGSGINTASLMTYGYRVDGKMVEQDANLNGYLNRFSFTFTAAGRRSTMTDPATGGVVPAAKARSVKGAHSNDGPASNVAKYVAVVASPPDLLKLLGSQRGTENADTSQAVLTPLQAVSMNDTSFVEPPVRSPNAPRTARPTATVKNSVVATKAHAIIGRKPRTSVNGTFVATQFYYDNYGRLTSETLPTGYQYTGITYDSEAEVTSFSAYGDPANLGQIPTELVKNSYTVRGELQGQHYYPNGGPTYTDTWPHFSSQSADGYNLPASENVGRGQTLYTSYYASDDRSNTNYTYDNQNRLLQAYGWQIDAAARQTIGRWEGLTPQSTYIYGSEQRRWDGENRLASWTILTVDPDHPTVPMSGWPIQGPDVNIKCAGPAPGQIGLYPPGSSISYIYGPNGHLSGNSVQNVGQAAVREQIHYDGDQVLFTTDGTGQVDNVRIGISAIVLPGGQATMFDRDWNGSWVLTHSASGYSYWVPPDPNLQNCQPQSPPVGSANYQPAGLPMQFANLSADTLTDGYNFFAGARTYDPLISEWTSPDPATGSREDPMSQMPYIWNRSNPVTYQDPTGFCSDPGGKGTRVCIDFFIPQNLWGSGDNRSFQNFESRSQDRYRVRVDIDFDGAKNAPHFDVHPSTIAGFEFESTNKINTYKWISPTEVEIHVEDSCGLCRGGLEKFQAITADFRVKFNDDGTTSITGMRSFYPAVEGYYYNSKGAHLFLRGDALGPPALGTLKALPKVPMDLQNPFWTFPDVGMIDPGEIPQDMTSGDSWD